jgi:hypothetical protein
MIAPRAHRPVLIAGCLLATIAVTPRTGWPQAALRAATSDAAASGPLDPARPAASPAKAPRGFLIYLLDGRDPIVVKAYEEADDQIRFEKYGGTVSIPRYEVLRIVPDQPEEALALPPAPPVPLEPPEPPPAEASPVVAPAPADTLFVTMKGGASVKATAVTAEGDRVRVSVPDGSFSVARADLVGVVRMPSGAGVPEAWITLLTGNGESRAAPEPALKPGGPGDGSPLDGTPRADTAPAPTAPVWQPPYPSSDRPHLVRLANGRLLRADGFWIEDGEIKLRRLGGIVGMAFSEVLRLIPEQLAPVHGRTAVRFGRQLGPDVLEVRGRSGPQRVRLIGVDPVAGVEHADSPWPRLALGLVVYLEFDRQRYDGGGDWLAYVFLPNGRMLNAELIRLGLARPRPDGRNLRYVDLFQELAEPDPAAPILPTASTK